MRLLPLGCPEAFGAAHAAPVQASSELLWPLSGELWGSLRWLGEAAARDGQGALHHDQVQRIASSLELHREGCVDAADGLDITHDSQWPLQSPHSRRFPRHRQASQSL